MSARNIFLGVKPPSVVINSFSLLFNGSSQNVTIPNAPVNSNADFTIECWIKVAAAADSNAIFSAVNGSNYWVLINRNDSRGLCWQVDTTGTATFVGAAGGSGNVAVADGWTHIALVRSGNSFLFYKNGTLLKSDTYTGTSTPTTNQEIAHLSVGSGNYFNGRIDEVRVWNVARTATEINNNKSLVISGSTTGLRGYWRFEAGSGSTAADSQTNISANNGTLVGSPTWSTDKPF